jgi:HK97 gp10 family phage protein
MAERVKVEGLRELQVALKELPKATGKNVLRRVLKTVAQPLAEAMRSMAPDDPGTQGDDLRSGIAASPNLSPRQKSANKKIFGDEKTAAEIFVGPSAANFYGFFQEFGTVHHAPQPFMRPAWDAGKGPLLDSIEDALWTEIAKTAARLAKRQAKRAAAGK